MLKKLIPLLIAILFVNSIDAQVSTCTNPSFFNNCPVCLDSQYVVGAEKFYEFTANDTGYVIDVHFTPLNTNSSPYSLVVLTNACDLNSTIAYDTVLSSADNDLSVSLHNLVIGNTYYIRIANRAILCPACPDISGVLYTICKYKSTPNTLGGPGDSPCNPADVCLNVNPPQCVVDFALTNVMNNYPGFCYPILSSLQGLWFKLKVLNAGPVRFNIEYLAIPPNLSEPNIRDVDFAIFDVSGFLNNPPDGCNAIMNGSLPPIRCSYANTINSSNYSSNNNPSYIQIGLNSTATDVSESGSGDGWLKEINANCGDEYLILITKRNPPSFQSTIIDPDFSFSINLINPPQPTFTPANNFLSCSNTVQFQNTMPSTSHCNPIQWDFGDPASGGNNSSFVQNPTHTFTSPGSYQVCLSVWNCAGQELKTCHTIIINPVTVNAGPDVSICPGTCTNLTASVNGGTGNYTFSWSTGATTQTINVCPTTSTAYTITVTDGGGCTVTDVIGVNVVMPIPPIISASLGLSLCTNANGTLSISGNYTNIFWSCNNGTVVGNPTLPTVQFNWINPSATNTVVTVTAIDVNGCNVTATYQLPPCCPCSPTATRVCLTNTTAQLVLMQYPQFVINGNQFTAPNITINGFFIIDVPFEFLNCLNIQMAGNAAIIDNTSLKLTNCNLLPACGYMWDGIYITQTAAQLQCSNTNMRQARNAIVSQNGGYFSLSNNCIIRDCYKGVVVEPYANAHSGSIASTNFISQSSFITALPPLPSNNNRMHIGVEVTAVNGITIGTPVSNATANVFTNMDIGIYTERSLTNVYNNTFQNITFVLNNVLDGYAILAVGAKQQPINQTLNAGALAGFHRNSFSNCFQGISVQGHHHVNVINNSIVNSKFGVYVQSCVGKTVVINNNNLTASNTPFIVGIGSLDNLSATLTVNNNTLINGIGNPAQQIGTGIYVANANPINISLTANNNTVNQFQTGLMFVNLLGTGTSFNLVFNNKVTFSKANNFYSTPHFGIRLQNCDNITVDENRVTKTLPNPTLPMVGNLRGISVENSTFALISENILTRTGSGIYIDGACAPQTFMVCNELRSNYNGMYFNNANINDQLPLGISQHNNWFTPAGPFKMDGSVVIQSPLTKLNYNTGLPNCPGSSCDPNPYEANNLINLNVTSVGVSNFDVCGFVLFQQLNAQQRDSMFSAVVTNLKVFSIDSSENKFWDKIKTYRYFKRNPNALQLNNFNDITYQNFFQQCNNTCLGTIETINDDIVNGNNLHANTTNNAFLPQTLIELNRKQVNEIYLNTWANEIYSFSSQDSSTLLNIAMQNPLTNGDAVYSARVMLKINVDNFNSSNRVMSDETKNNNEQNFVANIYPNPANDKITLEYNFASVESRTFEIIDLMGKKLIVQKLVDNGGIFEFDTKELKEGVYIYTISINGIVTDSGKLIIIR